MDMPRRAVRTARGCRSALYISGERRAAAAPRAENARVGPFGADSSGDAAPRRGPAARTAEPARAPGHRPAPVTASPGGRLGRASSCRGRGFPQAVDAIATCERLLAEFEAEAYAVEVHPTEDHLARAPWRPRLRTLGSPAGCWIIAAIPPLPA